MSTTLTAARRRGEAIEREAGRWEREEQTAVLADGLATLIPEVLTLECIVLDSLRAAKAALHADENLDAQRVGRQSSRAIRGVVNAAIAIDEAARRLEDRGQQVAGIDKVRRLALSFISLGRRFRREWPFFSRPGLEAASLRVREGGGKSLEEVARELGATLR